MRDAYEGVQALRTPAGMISNVGLIGGTKQVQIFDASFAPTDVGLDLLIQLSALDYPELKTQALRNLANLITQLQKLPRHEGGQFYRSYLEMGVVDRDVSSIDNLHLALGLWSVAQRPDSEVAEEARTLFSTMDFSAFYDAELRSIGGNLRYQDGKWTLDAYRYGLGSEARSLYFLGYALDLFKKIPGGSHSLLAAIQGLPLEVAHAPQGDYLRVWDGGLFQAALPTLLLGETVYHPFFAESQRVTWQLLLQAGGEIPWASSASLTEVVREHGTVSLKYEGKAGLTWLKSERNPDRIEEKLFVPHAFLLAGLASPSEALTHMQRVAALFSATGRPVFLPHFGWISAITAPDGTCLTAVVTEGVTGVDKAMEALSLFSYQDPDRFSPSARLLWENPLSRSRLMRAFAAISI